MANPLEESFRKAWEEWGFNCGPGALCAVLGKAPDEIRPLMGDFESKRYTNPKLMKEVLKRAGVGYVQTYRGEDDHPALVAAMTMTPYQSGEPSLWGWKCSTSTLTAGSPGSFGAWI